MHDYRSALQVAIDAADEAARILLAECARPDGPRGPLGHCPADDEAEWAIRRRLSAQFPGWGFRGEETGYQPPGEGETHLWVVDPNDGTEAMQRGYRGHAVSIGLLRDGIPVLGVVQAVDAPDDAGDRFAWAEGCGPLTRNGAPVERDPWPERLGPQEVVLGSHAADRHPAGNLACLAPARLRAMASIAYRLALAAAGEGVAGASLNGPGAVDYAGGHALLRGVGGSLVDQMGAEVYYGRDGSSSTRRCFGGGPSVVRELAGCSWHIVPGSGFGEAAPPPGFEPAHLSPGSLVHDTEALRRAQGCLLGQVAGDALGALVEFQTRPEIAAQYPDAGPHLLADGGPHGIIAGQPTDDSELALMLARTLVHLGRFDPEAVAISYARWYHRWTHASEPVPCRHEWCDPFDVGGTTRTALRPVMPEDVRAESAAQTAMRAASRSSQANGALMRVSPLGIWGWRHDPVEVAEAARADARLTHPDPVCQEASALFATTIAHAIASSADARQTFQWARAWAHGHCQASEVARALGQAERSLPQGFDGPHRGWVLIALQNAFFQLRHAPSLEEAVVATVRQGGDTDTNAAICGALLGAVYGREAVPAQWRRMVLSCRPMPGHAHIPRPRPALFWPADALTLAERLMGCKT
ncbi:MAG: ADP-ribosylglycohydrolase family protein [Chloroflexi bacterium]|nr:ADP-ribosylglycohydrolase family protein [Chloroflexota bacterium]